MPLDPTSLVVASRSQVSSEIRGEVVILELAQGAYYGLGDVGATIWKLLAEPRTVTELRDAVVAEFDVEPSRCERDLLSLIDEMHRGGLVEFRDGPAT